jgi:hypothetical protein
MRSASKLFCLTSLSILSLTLCFRSSIAQMKDSCYAGVYKTSDDFIHDRLSFKTNTASAGYKLTFTFPADLTLTLKIETSDTTLKFPPGSIYGYRECKNIYRFYRGGKELNAQEDFYKIEQAGSLILYSSMFISGDEIFYSTSLTSPIHRLTLRNLKSDFKNDPHFIAEAKKLKRHPDGLATRTSNGFEILKLYDARHAKRSVHPG